MTPPEREGVFVCCYCFSIRLFVFQISGYSATAWNKFFEPECVVWSEKMFLFLYVKFMVPFFAGLHSVSTMIAPRVLPEPVGMSTKTLSPLIERSATSSYVMPGFGCARESRARAEHFVPHRSRGARAIGR